MRRMISTLGTPATPEPFICLKHDNLDISSGTSVQKMLDDCSGYDFEAPATANEPSYNSADDAVEFGSDDFLVNTNDIAVIRQLNTVEVVAVIYTTATKETLISLTESTTSGDNELALRLNNRRPQIQKYDNGTFSIIRATTLSSIGYSVVSWVFGLSNYEIYVNDGSSPLTLENQVGDGNDGKWIDQFINTSSFDNISINVIDRPTDAFGESRVKEIQLFNQILSSEDRINLFDNLKNEYSI